MNNYPERALETYAEKFDALSSWFKKRVPGNLDLRYMRIGDKHDKKKIIEQVEVLIPERKQAFARLGKDNQDKELHRSMRSVMWYGDKDFSGLTEAQKLDKIIESRIVELAYYETESRPEFLGDYLWDDDHICICFSFGLSPDNAFEDLALSSAEGSIVDFWIGRGVLESRDGKLNPRIMSRKQYEELDRKPDCFKVKTDGLELRNLQDIEIINHVITPAEL